MARVPPEARCGRGAPPPSASRTSSVPPCASITRRATARPRPVPCVLAGDERLEDALAILDGDAGAAVGHVDAQGAAVRAHRHGHRCPSGARVVEQVHQHLAQPIRVDAPARRRVLHMERDRDVGGVASGAVSSRAPLIGRRQRLAHQRRRIGRCSLQRAGAYKGEQVGRQLLQPRRLVDDSLRLGARLVAGGQHLREQLGVALERGQRVADLVRQHRGHLAEAGQSPLSFALALVGVAPRLTPHQHDGHRQEARRRQRADAPRQPRRLAQRVGLHRLHLDHRVPHRPAPSTRPPRLRASGASRRTGPPAAPRARARLAAARCAAARSLARSRAAPGARAGRGLLELAIAARRTRRDRSPPRRRARRRRRARALAPRCA